MNGVNGVTLVSIRKTDRVTRVNNIPVYSLDYIAGDQRPHISIQGVNENYLNKVGLKTDQKYLCTWTQLEDTTNPNTGEAVNRYAMQFELVNLDPISLAIKVKEMHKVFGDNKQAEAEERARYRHSTVSGTTPAEVTTNAVAAGGDNWDVED